MLQVEGILGSTMLRVVGILGSIGHQAMDRGLVAIQVAEWGEDRVRLS